MNTALSVGAVLGDSDARSMAWSRAIGALSVQAKARAADVVSPLLIDVVYHVDGRLAPDEFQGVRTGRFTKATPLLVVQAALPRELTPDPRATLLGLLEEAVAEAERFAARKRIADALPEIRELLHRLEVA